MTTRLQLQHTGRHSSGAARWLSCANHSRRRRRSRRWRQLSRFAAYLHAPSELTYEIDEIYICEDNSNALALPPTLRRRCHWHRCRRDGAEPLHAAFYHDALQLRG